jgi:hypothetical protein
MGAILAHCKVRCWSILLTFQKLMIKAALPRPLIISAPRQSDGVLVAVQCAGLTHGHHGAALATCAGMDQAG